MPMQRKTITITDQMENWVKAQVDSGKYGNDSEYFQDLIRRDQDSREAETQLRFMLDEAAGLETFVILLIYIWLSFLVDKRSINPTGILQKLPSQHIWLNQGLHTISQYWHCGLRPFARIRGCLFPEKEPYLFVTGG